MTKKADDRHHGIYRVWHRTGLLEYEDNIIDKKYHGIRQGWYGNGCQYFIEYYHQGEQHGRQRVWGLNNNLLADKEFYYGRQIEN